MSNELEGDASIVRKEQFREATLGQPGLDDAAEGWTPRTKPNKTLKGIVSLVSISDAIPCGGVRRKDGCGSYTCLSMMASSAFFSGTMRSLGPGNVQKMLGVVFEVPKCMCISIDRLRFFRDEVLGRGAFGEVIRGELSMVTAVETSRVFSRANSCASFSSLGRPVSGQEDVINFETNSGEGNRNHVTDSSACGGVVKTWPGGNCGSLHSPYLSGDGMQGQGCRHEGHLSQGLTQPAQLASMARTHSPLGEVVGHVTTTSDNVPAIRMNNSPHQPLCRTLDGGGVAQAGSQSNVMTPSKVDEGQMFKSVAIKRVEKARLLRRQQFVTSFQTELHFAVTLRHPSIAHVYGVAEDDAELHLLMDVAERGTLKEYMRAHDSEVLRDMAPCLLADVVLGLEYLQSLGVAHRDIKPGNMLLTRSYHVLLADFGIACYLHDDKANTFGGTAAYMSPEMVELGKASATSDLWALGCVLFELLVGHPPFQGENRMFVMRKIKEYQNDLPECSLCLPVAAKDLLHRLLQRDPIDRLGSDATGGFEALKAHPFFAGIDWAQVQHTSNNALHSPRHVGTPAAGTR